MSSTGSRLKYQLRRAPRFFQFLLRKLGCDVNPFLTTCEKSTPPDFDLAEIPYELGFLGVEDIDEILAIEPVNERREITEWFDEGKLCFGVRDGPRLIGKMWCDLKALNYPPAHRPLNEDEVYLYAACVSNDYRGKNIAPLMRSACCAALSEMGRTRFCSYTDYFNYPARRFKEKLGAKHEALFVHLDLFGKWSWTWKIRQYS